jgi:hypothetical protein
MVVAIGLVCAQVAVAGIVVNDSFESPAIPWISNSHFVSSDPADDVFGGGQTLASLGGVPGWTFSGHAGLLGSIGTGLDGMWVDNGGVETRNGLDGYQCASWQSYDTGTISQVLNVDADMAAAQVSFYGSGYNASSLMQVTLDGNALSFGGSTAAIALNNTPSTLSQLTSDAFTLTAGPHTLTFTAPTGVANIDRVSVNEVPEPSTLCLLASGLIGLVCYAWRKRK